MDRELTLEEAKVLYQELHKLFGGKNFYENSRAIFSTTDGVLSHPYKDAIIGSGEIREFKPAK